VRVFVGELVEVNVAAAERVSTESVVSVGVGEVVPVGLEVGVSRIWGSAVGNGRAVSSGVAGAVKNVIGMAGKLYRSAASSPKRIR
jgi:hypothetical protein